MGRKKNKEAVKPVLFIACEGTSSEYQYFESWAQTDEALENFERIDVYPDEREERPKTTPYELFETAKKILNEGTADFAWIVFDKDIHPKLRETFEEARRAGISIAFSSRSFEEWVLLHFEKNIAPFHATECKSDDGKPLNCGTERVPGCTPIDCLTGHIRRQKFIADYSKKKTFDLYATIKSRTEIALVNASWLRFKMNASLNLPQPVLFNLNPYSDADQLILTITGRSDKIEWGIAGQNVTLNNRTICVSIIRGYIVLELSHANPTPDVLNALFPLPMFYTTDDTLGNTCCTMIRSRYLKTTNGSTHRLLCRNDVIEYTLKNNNQPYFLFYDRVSRTRMYIEL